MFYLVLLVVALIAVGLYVTLILRLVPGAEEERLGVLEALPPDVGVWKTDDSSPDAVHARSEGLVRQFRLCHEPTGGRFGGERLTRQVRYRSAATNEIVRIEPEQLLKRKRIRR